LRPQGVARALLSDSYRVMDNYELLLAVLDGIQELVVRHATLVG
jgi:hypothetical protein